MKFLVCLFLTLGIAYGAILPIKRDCTRVFCTMDIKICPDGTPAPIPVGGCCPSLSACRSIINRNRNCDFVMCTMQFLVCPDGSPAGVPPGECCQSLRACQSTGVISKRSNPLSSLLSGSNLLQTLGTATHGTDLGTVLSILKLLNNIHQLSNDVHQIPLLINQTLASIVNGTGQASQAVMDQLIAAVSNVAHPETTGRDLLSSLGQNLNLISTVSKLLPKGTSISTVLSLLKLLNNVHALNNDLHEIPVLLQETLQNVANGVQTLVPSTA